MRQGGRQRGRQSGGRSLRQVAEAVWGNGLPWEILASLYSNHMNKEEFQDRSQEAQDEIQQAAEGVRSKVQDKAKQFQQTAQDWQRRAAKTSREAAAAADDYVHENPWPIVGSVALGCFILGFIMGRSRD